MKERTEKEKTEQAEPSPPNESEAKIADLTDTLKRLQAEFDNYRKRQAAEQDVHDRKVMANLLRKLLPIVDSFQMSIKSLNDSCKPEHEQYKKGIELLYAQLYAFMKEQGVREMAVQAGKELFDHNKHEVLMLHESELPEHTIIEVFQTGYWYNDEVLRTAKVKCAMKKNQ
ncbi:MAG: nucleotide exchange factor GrpE [archaeon]